MNFLRIPISSPAARGIRGKIDPTGNLMSTTRLEIAKKAGLQAGKELLDLFKTGPQVGELKADRTLVTEADRRADQLIQSLISEVYPQDGILSEENSTVLPRTEHTWILDPLDGTVNFSHGLLYWGVSIAHLKNGFPEDGAVYFPVPDELYTASAGQGAALNGTPLSLSGKDPGLFPIFAHCSRMHQRYEIRTPYKTRSLGAAAYHLCMVAGAGAVLALESTPRIWDFAASWLIVQEAGGAIRALGEEEPFPVQPGLDYAKKPFPILAASSPEILAAAAEGITPIIS